MLKNTFILIFTICISLLLIEISLQIYHHIKNDQTTLVWQDDKYVGQRLLPNQTGLFVSTSEEYKTEISTNTNGWRDINHSFDKPENTYRILFLGDSFVENFQVPFDKTFFRQIQNNIPEANGKKVEVLATGLGNTGTAQQLLILQNYSLKYHPDLVVQLFLTANDIKNNSEALQNEPYMPYFKINNRNLEETSFQLKNSRPLSKLKNVLKNFQIVNLLLSARQRLIEKADATKLNYPVDYHVYDMNYSNDYNVALDITQKLIIKTKEEVENSGAKYILVTLANNEQVNKTVWAEAQKTYPKMNVNKMDLQKPDKLIKNFCDNEKLTCWQMLPYFLDYMNNHPESTTHYHYDGHWNELGTNLTAQFLTTNLFNYFSIK